MLDHAALVRTNAVEGAPLAGTARYPVVVYSHGWNGFRAINANQMEALANHGYVAVGINHTYGALVTVLADGRVALNNPAALPDDAPDDVYQRAKRAATKATYAADVEFVLDQLARLDAGAVDPRFAGRLDLGRIGLFGHSTGGGAIALVWARRTRAAEAGLGMDTWVVPVPKEIMPGPLRQPDFCCLCAARSGPHQPGPPRSDVPFAARQPQGYRLTIMGTRHFDFTLMPLFSPLAAQLGLKGPLEGRRTLQIITDYLLAFFDTHLKGHPSGLLDGPAAGYPEVRFERR